MAVTFHAGIRMRQKIPGIALYPGPTQIFTCMGGEPENEAIPGIRHTILSIL